MKKFALTAIAVAMFSGSASAALFPNKKPADMNLGELEGGPAATAGAVDMPEGYRARAEATGIVRIEKQDAEGNWVTESFHVVTQDTIFVNMVDENGNPVYTTEVKAIDPTLIDKAQEGIDKWVANNGAAAEGGYQPDMGVDMDGTNGGPVTPDLPNDDGQELPNSGEGDTLRPMPPVMDGTNDDNMGHTPMPDFGNGEAGGDDNTFPQPGPGEGSVERPTPGTGEGSVERPRPGQGEGSVERPRPGNGEGSVSRPQPGENNRPGAGTGEHKPFPGTGVERPQPPAFIGQINQNKDNIAAMGEAFEQRVDAVNGYLSQAGQAIANNSAAIQNNSDRITNLESAFEQQAAHTAKEISRLDDRIDGIGAMSQAVTAARPQLFGNQTSAIGMGIGHMGDATALAAGYVHRINENWSANANISTTFGTDNRDTSVGAGVAYAW